MRFVVRSRVKSNDLHLPVCKRIGREKQEARNLIAKNLARQAAEEKIEKFKVRN